MIGQGAGARPLSDRARGSHLGPGATRGPPVGWPDQPSIGPRAPVVRPDLDRAVRTDRCRRSAATPGTAPEVPVLLPGREEVVESGPRRRARPTGASNERVATAAVGNFSAQPGPEARHRPCPRAWSPARGGPGRARSPARSRHRRRGPAAGPAGRSALAR